MPTTACVGAPGCGGSQEEVQVSVQEEQAGADPQEIQAQEVLEAEEEGEDLPECVDYQPSSFERDD